MKPILMLVTNILFTTAALGFWGAESTVTFVDPKIGGFPIYAETSSTNKVDVDELAQKVCRIKAQGQDRSPTYTRLSLSLYTDLNFDFSEHGTLARVVVRHGDLYSVEFNPTEKDLNKELLVFSKLDCIKDN